MKHILLSLLAIICFFNNIFSQNVGIGTTTPTNALHVVGTVGADPLKVEGLNAFVSEQHVLVVNPTTGVVRHMLLDSLSSRITSQNVDSIIDLVRDSLFNDSIFIDSVNTDSQNLTLSNDTLFIENGNWVVLSMSLDTNLIDSLINLRVDTFYTVLSDSLLMDSSWVYRLDSILGGNNDTIFFNDSSYTLNRDSLLLDSIFLSSLQDSIETNVDSLWRIGDTLYLTEDNNIIKGFIKDSSVYNDSIFTTGSVIFADSSGSLAEENLNFFWDQNLNKLRIGDRSLPISWEANNASGLVLTDSNTANWKSLLSVQTGNSAYANTWMLQKAPNGGYQESIFPEPGGTSNYVISSQIPDADDVDPNTLGVNKKAAVTIQGRTFTTNLSNVDVFQVSNYLVPKLTLKANDDFRLHSYQNTRIDTNAIDNFLYTTADGTFQSQPIDSLAKALNISNEWISDSDSTIFGRKALESGDTVVFSKEGYLGMGTSIPTSNLDLFESTDNRLRWWGDAIVHEGAGTGGGPAPIYNFVMANGTIKNRLPFTNLDSNRYVGGIAYRVPSAGTGTGTGRIANNEVHYLKNNSAGYPMGKYTIDLRGEGENGNANGGSDVATFLYDKTIQFNQYGLGNMLSASLSKTNSPFLAGFATDGTIIELHKDSLAKEIMNTDSLFTPGSVIFAGPNGELTEDSNRFLYNKNGRFFEVHNNLDNQKMITNGEDTYHYYHIPSNIGVTFEAYRVGTGTISSPGNTLLNRESFDQIHQFWLNGAYRTGIEMEYKLTAISGNNAFGQVVWRRGADRVFEINTSDRSIRSDNYGAGNMESSDLTKTGTNYLAGFATDGTIIEYSLDSLSNTINNSKTSIYSHDDTIFGARSVDGNGRAAELFWNDFESFEIYSNQFFVEGNGGGSQSGTRFSVSSDIRMATPDVMDTTAKEGYVLTLRDSISGEVEFKPIDSLILVTDTTVIQNTDTVQGVRDYDTVEHWTGERWINGKKIFRVVDTITQAEWLAAGNGTTTNGVGLSVPAGVYDDIVRLDVYWRIDDGGGRKFEGVNSTTYQSDEGFGIGAHVQDFNRLILDTGNSADFSSGSILEKCIVVMEYTK